jgi:rubrerythrin
MKAFTIGEFLAHALAIEVDAVACYQELARRMWARRNPGTAALFEEMAKAEEKHLVQIQKRTAAYALPDLAPSEYRWRGPGSPEAAPIADVDEWMTRHRALKLALAGEERARDFFAEVAESESPPEVRALARELRDEEAEHVRYVAAMLARTPEESADWAEAGEEPDKPE